MKAGRDYQADLIEDLKEPGEAAAYLDAALDEGNKEAFLLALRNVLDAHGMSEVARKTGLNRVSLYKMLSKRGNPGFENILTLLKVLRVRIHIVERPASKSRKAA